MSAAASARVSASRAASREAPRADGPPQRLGFEEQPYVVDLARHVRVHHAHRDALVLAHHDEPGPGQGLERLAHRGLRHPELCGELGLDQGLTGRQLPGEDARA